MILDVGRLAPGPQTVEGDEESVLTDLHDAVVRVETPIHYRLTVELLPGEVLVRGMLSCRVAFVCVRCARPFVREIRVTDFVRSYACPDPLTLKLDLTEDFREDTILAFPTHPVCAETCRGLCPRCGEDLNERECRCSKGFSATGWEPLDALNLTE